MNDGKLRFYDNGKETFSIQDPYWGKCQTPETQLHIKEMTHEEMLEIAHEREMKVTEHNITETDLSIKDINELIRLVKNETKNHEGDRATLLYYGVLIGKLVSLRHDHATD